MEDKEPKPWKTKDFVKVHMEIKNKDQRCFENYYNMMILKARENWNLVIEATSQDTIIKKKLAEAKVTSYFHSANLHDK